MANMIIRSILALFVCASLAACSANKDSSAPVRMGTNAKPQGQQTQPQANTQTNSENGRQPSTNANANTTNTQVVNGTDSSTDTDTDAAKKDKSSTSDAKPVAKTSSSTSTSSSSNTTVKSTSSSTSNTSNTSSAAPKVAASQPAATTSSAAPAVKTQTAAVTAPATSSGATSASTTATVKNTNKAKDKSAASDEEVRNMQIEASRYTGSADDYLRNYLLQKENNLTQDQQNANLKMANQIQSASLGIDYDSEDGTGSGDVIVRLNLHINGKDSQVTLAGNLDNDRLKSSLQVTSGSSKLKGALICLDRNDGLQRPTCETAVADIRGAKGASVKIIFRRTNQDFQEHFNMKMCTSNECYDLYSMFAETHGYQQGTIKTLGDLVLEKTKMESYEVINGRSGFRVLMLTAGDVSQVTQQRINKQIIEFGGPLYNQDVLSSSQPMVAADRHMNPEDQMNYKTGANYKTDLNRTLQDIRIISNDGFGKISALITIGSKNPNVVEQFQLDIARKTAELRPMENMNLK